MCYASHMKMGELDFSLEIDMPTFDSVQGGGSADDDVVGFSFDAQAATAVSQDKVNEVASKFQAFFDGLDAEGRMVMAAVFLRSSDGGVINEEKAALQRKHAADQD